jgi:hypothetical protein
MLGSECTAQSCRVASPADCLARQNRTWGWRGTKEPRKMALPPLSRERASMRETAPDEESRGAVALLGSAIQSAPIALLYDSAKRQAGNGVDFAQRMTTPTQADGTKFREETSKAGKGSIPPGYARILDPRMHGVNQPDVAGLRSCSKPGLERIRPAAKSRTASFNQRPCQAHRKPVGESGRGAFRRPS